MGRLALPKQRCKRHWGWLLIWTTLVFCGGGVTGFVEKDRLLEVVGRLGLSLGQEPAVPMPPVNSISSTSAATPTPTVTERPTPKVEPAPTPAAVPPSAPAAAEPAPQPEHKSDEAEAHVSASAKAAGAAHGAGAGAPSGKHGKGAAKAAAVAEPSSSGQKASGFDNPFATKTAKSSDALDSLMQDAPGDSKGKKRESSKDIDALLKEVQKPRAEPAPKKEAPLPPAASLSASDISRVMSGVKARSKECAAKLGQKGVAELKIVVAKSGSVSDVHLGGKLVDTPVGSCIEKVARAAIFPPSSGLVFDYRIDAH